MPEVERPANNIEKGTRDQALGRVLRLAEYRAGPRGEAPTFYRYVHEQLVLIAASRGMREAAPGNRLGAPEGTATLVVEPPQLTPTDLAEATTAVWEHDEMTPAMRRESGMPLGEDGIPVSADVEAVLEFIDQEDPQTDFTLTRQVGEIRECVYSCRCWERGTINPTHRREVLDRDGVPYDPPGTSPRNKELRNAWRQEKARERRLIRERGQAQERRYRGTTVVDKAVPFGAPQHARWNVDPEYVQLRRDQERAQIGLPTVVDPAHAEALVRGYVGSATRAHLGAGFVPQTPEALWDPTQASPPQRLEPRRGLRGLARRVRGTPEPTRSSEDEIARVDAQLEDFLRRHNIGGGQLPEARAPEPPTLGSVLGDNEPPLITADDEALSPFVGDITQRKVTRRGK